MEQKLNKKEQQIIDRKIENERILEYLETRDETIFNEVYKNRIYTIDYLANQYKWVVEDSASEIRLVLVKTLNSYGKNGKKTDFNTYFFTSVKNHFANLIKKKYRKKRDPRVSEDQPAFIFSLDDIVTEDGTNYHEFIACENNELNDYIYNDYAITIMSGGSEFLKKFINKILSMKRKEILTSVIKENFVFDIVSGEYVDDICNQIEIDKKLYEITNINVKNNKIEAEISIYGKKLLNLLYKRSKEYKSKYGVEYF